MDHQGDIGPKAAGLGLVMLLDSDHADQTICPW